VEMTEQCLARRLGMDVTVTIDARKSMSSAARKHD